MRGPHYSSDDGRITTEHTESTETDDNARRTPPLRGGPHTTSSENTSPFLSRVACAFRRSSGAGQRPAQPADVRRAIRPVVVPSVPVRGSGDPSPVLRVAHSAVESPRDASATRFVPITALRAAGDVHAAAA